MNSTPSSEDARREKPIGRSIPVNAPGTPSGGQWVGWALVFYGLLAGVALVWSAWAGTPWAFADGEAERAGVSWLRDGVAGLACAAAVIAVSELLTRRWPRARELAAELGSLLGPLGLRHCLILAACSGFAEEVFFRGVLQPRLGWLGATVLFGLAHIPPTRTLWLWSVFALLAGGLLGALFSATGNLLAPVVAHAGINAVNLTLLSRRFGRPEG